MRADYEPSAEQEVKHLAEQCNTLLRENELLRAEIEALMLELRMYEETFANSAK